MSQSLIVEFLRLKPQAIVPEYKSELAAGADLSACLESPVTIMPQQRLLIPSGLAVALPAGYEAQVRPRSGLALQKGISCLNAPGTVDADYRGEIGIILINHGTDPVVINHGDRIAQLVIAPVLQASFKEVSSLPPTDRAANGFGSTGFS